MLIDKLTLKDLEIFKPSEENLSLFDLLDRTITSGGRFNLEHKFNNPLTDINQIRTVQETVSFISQDERKWKLPFSDRMMKSLENYITCNIDPVRGARKLDIFITGIRYFIGERNIYYYLRESIVQVIEYINLLKKYLKQVNSEKQDALLKIFTDRVLSFADLTALKEVSDKISSQGKISFTDVFYYDGLFRSGLKRNLRNILDLAYELDALVSMAKVSSEFGLCRPDMIEGENFKLEINGLYHLALKDPVPYSFLISAEKNILFVTGPNMAGKTTFLKSIGIAVFLAHIGMCVPAESMKVSYYDRLITGLTVTDSILSGYSFFFSEVRRVKEVAEALCSQERVFAIFDELFKGTNVKDAYDSSEMIISGFSHWKNSLFILSSHLAELYTDIKNYDSICYRYFESEVKDGIPKFNYRLCEGISDARLGTIIIRNEKIPDLLNKRNKI